MDIWIAVVGAYADARTLGVSHSPEGADMLIARARDLEEFEGYADYEWHVSGPFRIGEIYDGMGETL